MGGALTRPAGVLREDHAGAEGVVELVRAEAAGVERAGDELLERRRSR